VASAPVKGRTDTARNSHKNGRVKGDAIHGAWKMERDKKVGAIEKRRGPIGAKKVQKKGIVETHASLSTGEGEDEKLK